MLVRAVRIAILLPLLLVGCDTNESPPPELRGRFEGTFTYIAPPGPFSPGGSVSEEWVLSISEDGSGNVAGSGTLTVAVPVTVAGTHDHPNVVLDFTDDEGGSAGRFTGTLSNDGKMLDGVYDFGLFFADDPLTLTRVSVSLTQ